MNSKHKCGRLRTVVTGNNVWQRHMANMRA